MLFCFTHEKEISHFNYDRKTLKHILKENLMDFQKIVSKSVQQLINILCINNVCVDKNKRKKLNNISTKINKNMTISSKILILKYIYLNTRIDV